VQARWQPVIGEISSVTRPETASPATGSEKTHKYEQQLLVEQAFGDVPAKKS